MKNKNQKANLASDLRKEEVKESMKKINEQLRKSSNRLWYLYLKSREEEQ